jgi:syntaxin 5
MSYTYAPIRTIESTQLQIGDDHNSNPNDITNRFFQIVTNNNSKHTGKNGFANPPRSAFLETSQRIEKQIKTCIYKLKELEDITNRSSLFSNDDTKINDIIVTVKTNLNNIQGDMTVLIRTNDLHSSSDSDALAKNIISNLNMRFLELTKEFQMALQKRSKTIRNYEEKKKTLKSSVNKTKLQTKKGKKGEALFLQDNDADMEKRNGDNFVLVQEHELETEYLKGRSESIKNIEKMLGEVAVIFQRISTLVQMQETMIDRIDKHTEDTLVNVTKGKKHLISIYDNISSNRRMIFTVFFILLIFSVMYIVVFL